MASEYIIEFRYFPGQGKDMDRCAEDPSQRPLKGKDISLTTSRRSLLCMGIRLNSIEVASLPIGILNYRERYTPRPHIEISRHARDSAHRQTAKRDARTRASRLRIAEG